MNENLNFRLLNIDKYLKELTDLYYNFNEIRELPFYERLHNELLVKQFKRFSRRIMKGIIDDEKKILLTQSEIKDKQYYEKTIEKLKSIIHKVPYLDCFDIKMIDTKKEYLYFTKDELENFYNEDFNGVVTQINGLLPIFFEESILEIENSLKSSPLPKIEYYKMKLNHYKKDEFKFLERILEGKPIEKLDNLSICNSFFNEINRIKTIQYIENQIFKIDNPEIEPIINEKKQLTQKQIILLFQCLSEIEVFNKNIISQDNSNQIKMIALIIGVEIPEKLNNWNLYKYWNSVQSVTDDKQITTLQNLENILKIVKPIKFNLLENNILQKIKELK